MGKILIIENDLVLCRVLRNWLERKRMQVECVSSVAQARKAIAATDADIILSDMRLPDGKGELQGDDNYRSGRYIGLYGQDFDAIIDLQEMKEISSVSLGTYLVPGDYIFGLTGLEIYGSNDGSAYSKIASKTIPVLEKGSKNNVLKRDTVSFGKTKARYVRIIGKNIPVLPKWHPGAGKRTYLFLDEITID